MVPDLEVLCSYMASFEMLRAEDRRKFSALGWPCRYRHEEDAPRVGMGCSGYVLITPSTCRHISREGKRRDFLHKQQRHDDDKHASHAVARGYI
jgi:hypothetical protein